jgi:hypothetical protein
MPTETIRSLFIKHGEECFPDMFGPWLEEDRFDPRFKRKTLEYSENSGYIQIDRTDADNWKYRFTFHGANKKLSYDA